MSKEQLEEVGELAKVIRKEKTIMLIDNNRIILFTIYKKVR